MKKILSIINVETVRYLVVGGLTTLVNIISYAILYQILKIEVTISNVISVALAIIFAYMANKIFVFKSKTNSLKELICEMIKFCGARLSTMIIEVVGVFALYNIMKINPMISKILTQVIVVIVNYFISKFLVFNKRERK